MFLFSNMPLLMALIALKHLWRYCSGECDGVNRSTEGIISRDHMTNVIQADVIS